MADVSLSDVAGASYRAWCAEHDAPHPSWADWYTGERLSGGRTLAQLHTEHLRQFPTEGRVGDASFRVFLAWETGRDPLAATLRAARTRAGKLSARRGGPEPLRAARLALAALTGASVDAVPVLRAAIARAEGRAP